MTCVSKIRLDQLLVQRGLAESRAKAQALIMAGQVRVEGQTCSSPAASIGLRIAGGCTTARALYRGAARSWMRPWSLRIWMCDGRVCADVGASTGGFTDCLLQRGAAKVYAIDVGKGIVHWKLRTDPRVIVMEETNARFVKASARAGLTGHD